ncbi:MAG: PilZ domain-containing protein [Planctomycetes bacterium]|nr:PilZ domain-containing protein [Planctomycetota bacterium]
MREVQPREKRFAVKKLDSLYAAIGRPNDELATLPAVPIDITEGGIKLRVSSPFRFEESITLILGTLEGALRLAVSGRVTWLRQERTDSWLLGCKFVPRLPPDALEELFSSGILERRQFRRYPVSGQARGQWELQAESFNVWLVDISEGGFCVCCEEPGMIGQRLRLNIDSPAGTTVIHAKAQWCAPLDNAFLVGCGFLDHHSYVRLKSVVTTAPAAQSA